jgi:hypothetical protein
LASIKVTSPAPVSNMPSLKTEKLCSEVMTNVSHSNSKLTIPDEYAALNKTLLDELTRQQANLFNTVDRTVTVRQLYCLLCQVGILKEAAEKMLFL